MTSLTAALQTAGFRGKMLAEEPLGSSTTWKIGGPAEVLALPVNRDDLALAVGWAASNGVPWRILGNGSNLLVRDAGVRGLVIRVRRLLDAVTVHEDALVAGAGASFPAVANRAAQEGLAGLEFAAGIPGTVGGAIVMNAGWHEHETGTVVASVEVLEADGVMRRIAGADCGFGYRQSRFRGGKAVVLGATFLLVPEDPAVLLQRLEKYATSRRTSQPADQPSCGSVYLKPAGDFAGRLIDAAGLKGTRVGGIQVSSLHANFFVNLGGGSAADALALMERVEAEVHHQFGVHLAREVEIW